MYHLTPTGLAIRARMLLMLILLLATACGAPEEAKPRPLPEETRKLSPGTYRSELFEPSLSFGLGEGWTTSPPEVYDVLLLTRGHETVGLGFANLRGARFYKPTRMGTPYMMDVPKDMVGWFLQHPYLKTDEPKPVKVGGVEGTRLDVAVGGLPENHSGECGSGCVDLFRFSSGPPLALWEEDKARFIVLEDVEGETVLIGFISPATEFDEHAPEVRKVTDTVAWRGS